MYFILSSTDVAKSLNHLNLELELLSPSVYYTSVAVVRQLVYFAQATKASPINVPSIKNIGCAGEMLSPSISRSFSKLFGLDDFIPVNTYFSQRLVVFLQQPVILTSLGQPDP